uniref:Amino acid transporter n=1 Tax=Albugo laibachii Nc14 TaxID=890382 RepID=F0WRK5_9STRA|nr:dicarboxylate/Amino Acid:Cation (Na or H) Symporter (DAACS) family putative [Albugo laibachii Nc14]|eukprot:CCA23968.1 dicarboxylate/Amino Acid:Cation (Na or H) Symporter (DAACS) family putative [Albugo laibachii Nc14]
MRVAFASVDSFMDHLSGSFVRNDSNRYTFSPETTFIPSPTCSQHPSITPESTETLPLRSILRKEPLQTDNHASMDGLEMRDMFATGINQRDSISLIMILGSAIAGIALGFILSGNGIGEDATRWLELPGQLFIKALKCLIVPMVFCSIVTCIAKFIAVGQEVAVGARTIVAFVSMTILSSCTGTFFGWLFLSFFKVQKTLLYTEDVVPTLALRCPDGRYLTQLRNDTIVCMASRNRTENAQFELDDISYTFALKSPTFVNLSVSKEIFSLLDQLIPTNVLEAFVEGSTLGVISFAILFGVAITKSFRPKKEVTENYPLLLITQVGILVRMILNAVMAVLPIAIISLLAGAIVKLPCSLELVKSVGFLGVALLSALLTVTFGVLGLAMLVIARRNVFSYLKAIIPAQIFIASYCSSIATLPVTIRCVESTREVPASIARFVLSLGASCNLNGTAVYMPLACLFMAKISGIEPHLTIMSYIRLALVSAIASYGVAPVPHSGLVMVMTIWKTVFHTDVPAVFSIIVGVDWLLDRMCALVNVTNDALLARIIVGRIKDPGPAAPIVTFGPVFHHEPK